MDKFINFIKSISGLLIFIAIAVVFPDIFLYFVASLLLFLLCRPLTNVLEKIKIGKFKFNSTISSLIAIVLLFVVLIIVVMVAVPMFNREVNLVKNIDVQDVFDYFEEPINRFFGFLASINLVKSRDAAIEFLENEVYNIVNWANVKVVVGSVVSTTSSIFIGLFSTIFLVFFFLREPNIIKMIFLAIVPDKFETKTLKVLTSTRVMLSRYVVGLLVEVVCMATLITFGLIILKVPNPLMIGMFVALLHVIPYIGPLIGCIVGISFGVVAVLSSASYDTLMHCVISIPCVILVALLIDNFLFQPIIYSKSAKAHPVEVFLVILMGGSLGGIIGMIIAIPTYTVIRIIGKNFLGNVKFIDLLTRNMDEKNK